MKDKCMLEGCAHEKGKSRGVCDGHYNMMLKSVRSGKRTWKEFEDMDMCLEAKPGNWNPIAKK